MTLPGKDHAPSARGIVIAAPSSGSGKTLLTLGLLRALTNKGLSVSSAKVGPDYIDPAFHSAATGRPCLNIDPWAMRDSLCNHILAGLCQGAEMVVCEGVMGLFDGATATEGSTADVAAATGWPIILIVDARAQAASAAAVVRGFAELRADITIGGVIFNRIGSERHSTVIGDAMAHYLPAIPVLGYLPRHDALALPSRHLGLVQAGEHDTLETFLDQVAELITEHVDMEALMDGAAPLKTAPLKTTSAICPAMPVTPMTPIGQRIAVASDKAFAFSYAHVLDGWQRSGAEIQLFSPLADEAPWGDADAIYLPGGYPELHAGQLSSGSSFLPGLRQAADRGVAIYGECGGYMVLGEGLVDADGVRHAMAGLLPLETSFSERRLHLGYRHVTVTNPEGVNGGLGETTGRGHEFHYATIIREGDAAALFHVRDAAGNDIGTAGLSHGSVAGSFIHLIDRHE
ncbi:MAG: cobyrinate a,c-diamide synthase [Rhodospirillales bacterium]|nr:cobyrinate a,c-diamide synthase [Rhodospirillales bacterium]